MSSAIRNIQRTIARSKKPWCKAAHYLGRGSRLGVSNKHPKRKGGPRGSRRGTHKRPQRCCPGNLATA